LKFDIWKWSLLGALYGALPIPILLLIADVEGRIEIEGVVAPPSVDTLRICRNLLVIMFVCAIVPAYLVSDQYRRKIQRGEMQSVTQRWALIGYGALVAAAPAIALSIVFSYAIDKFLWQEPSLEGIVSMIVVFGVPIAICGAFATWVLLRAQRPL